MPRDTGQFEFDFLRYFIDDLSPFEESLEIVRDVDPHFDAFEILNSSS